MTAGDVSRAGRREWVGLGSETKVGSEPASDEASEMAKP